jgi:hypothetical protein
MSACVSQMVSFSKRHWMRVTAIFRLVKDDLELGQRFDAHGFIVLRVEN